MPAQCIRPDFPDELRDPLNCDEQAVNAMITAGTFVAFAGGRVETIERDEVVDYIHRQRLAPTISQRRIAELFDERARRPRERDFAELIMEALRPVLALSLASEVIRIAERVAAADKHVHPNEAQVIRLIRLITMSFPDPKAVEPSRKSASDRID
jgi:tellurite resistance protein